MELTGNLMSALESCDEAKPMATDIDEYPCVAAVLSDPLAVLLSLQLCI